MKVHSKTVPTLLGFFTFQVSSFKLQVIAFRICIIRITVVSRPKSLFKRLPFLPSSLDAGAMQLPISLCKGKRSDLS